MDVTTTAPEPLLLTIDEAARCLKVGRSTFYALLRAGDIRTVRIGGLRRVPFAELERYVDRLSRDCAA